MKNLISSWYAPLHDTFIDALPNLLRHFDAMPLTLAHGDYHLENLMFPAEGQNAPVILDWQITMHATAVLDLGYFLSQSLTPEDQRTYTDRLLTIYHQCLVQGGIADFPLAQLRQAYRLVCLFRLLCPLNSGPMLESSRPRSIESLKVRLTRARSAIEDLDSFGLLAR